MKRNEKIIEEIIAKMEKLDDLRWKLKENNNHAASASLRQEHHSLKQEIRADMADIGIDFDAVAAEFEDMRELAYLWRACLAG